MLQDDEIGLFAKVPKTDLPVSPNKSRVKCQCVKELSENEEKYSSNTLDIHYGCSDETVKGSRDLY